MRIIDVDPSFITEGNDPQMDQMQQLMAQAKTPWEKRHWQERIKIRQNQIAMIDVGGGIPLQQNGTPLPVEPDIMKWIQKNPTYVKDMPADALPPGMKEPGMMDKISGAVGGAVDKVFKWADNLPSSRNNLEIDKQMNRNDAMEESRSFGSSSYDPDYQGPGQYNNEVEELEALLGQTTFSSEEMQRRDFLAKKYGINGPQDFSKLQAIKNNELSRIGSLQQNLIKTSDDADAKYAADQERELALRAKYGASVPNQPQSIQEGSELLRIKALTSKLLKG
jgi:hypothetical protein